MQQPDLVAARHWTRLFAVRKEAQDARHVVALLHKAKQHIIAKSSRKKRKEGSATAGACSLARIAGISRKHVYGLGLQGGDRAEREAILVSFVKLARNLVKVDRLFRDLLGPQFVYKMGMMDPEWDLMMWSVLMNRHAMALFFWRRSTQPIIAALSSVLLYRSTIEGVRQEMRDEIEAAIVELEQGAVKVQLEAMDSNIRVSLEHLECPSPIWGGWTGYDLAVKAGCREFVTQCCRQANDERWYGDISNDRPICLRLNLGITSFSVHIPVSIALLCSVVFFPMLWTTLIYQLAHEPAVDAAEERQQLRQTTCFPAFGGKALQWWMTSETSLQLRWSITGLTLLPLVAVVQLLHWRNPKVSESQRAPGQLRRIPTGYPCEPFANQDLVKVFNFEVTRAIARELRQTSPPKLSRAAYWWILLRLQMAYFWNQLAFAFKLPGKTAHRQSVAVTGATTAAVAEQRSSRAAHAHPSMPTPYASNSNEIEMVMSCLTTDDRLEFYEQVLTAVNAGRQKRPSIADIQHYVAKKVSVPARVCWPACAHVRVCARARVCLCLCARACASPCLVWVCMCLVCVCMCMYVGAPFP